jgi:hypothetical protein
LLLLAFAFLRSARIFSTSDKSSTSSRDRLRTNQPSVLSILSLYLGSKHTIDAFVFALVIDIVEVSQHFESRNMGPSVINNALGTVLDEIF